MIKFVSLFSVVHCLRKQFHQNRAYDTLSLHTPGLAEICICVYVLWSSPKPITSCSAGVFPFYLYIYWCFRLLVFLEYFTYRTKVSIMVKEKQGEFARINRTRHSGLTETNTWIYQFFWVELWLTRPFAHWDLYVWKIDIVTLISVYMGNVRGKWTRDICMYMSPGHEIHAST